MNNIIICKNFKHKKSIENKIIVTEPSEEYYVIPLSKSFDMESDGEVFKLSFVNQLIWLKYSNHKKEILIKEYDYDEFIIIESKNILDIYINIHTNRYFRKNVWHCDNAVSLNKKYLGTFFLIIPIIEDMISIKEFGEGIKNYQIHMISNEVLLKKANRRGEHGCNLIITNNFSLNKDALFVPLKDSDVELFL